MADSNIKAWEDSITKHLKRQASITLTIPKVPGRLRRGENDAYEPRIMSFGPYHHGKPNLRAMEKYKWRFLEVILSFRPQIPLKSYIKAIKEEEAKIRTYYTDDFDMKSEDFVEMMLIDGCFLVGYFLKLYYRVPNDLELDSIFWMHDLIRYDILLLENQLPFSILIKIFKLLEFTTPSGPSSFMDLAINYLNCWVDEVKVKFQPPESVHHLLHLYHSYCLHTPQAREGREESDPIHQPPEAGLLPDAEGIRVPIFGEEHQPHNATLPPDAESIRVRFGEQRQPHSATMLYEAGVKFEKKEVKGSSSLDVTFDITNGKMMIPPLVIDSFTKSSLRNLVAFEQFYTDFGKLGKSFTAYVEFMDFIVDTPADVALLHKKGIIRHFLGSDKNAANFLNKLTQGVFVKSDHYLAALYKDVCYYQQKKYPEWWAILKQKYCNNPWAVVGLVVGGILLVLTLVQTILSGYSG